MSRKHKTIAHEYGYATDKLESLTELQGRLRRFLEQYERDAREFQEALQIIRDLGSNPVEAASLAITSGVIDKTDRILDNKDLADLNDELMAKVRQVLSEF